MHLHHQILKNGNLKITTKDRQGLWDVIEAADRNGNFSIVSDACMVDAFDDFIANSSFSWVNPEDIGALTEAPILGEGAYDEDYSIVPDARLWYYDPYMLKSPLEDLFVKGYVIFTAVNKE